MTGDPVSVWFFGASALFGDGQRDDHTIPSEFARRAEADGIPVEVRNYGRPGTSTWQELELFEQLVSTGQRPDLVVFYDGFNDLVWQMNFELTTEPTNIFDAQAGDATNAGIPDTRATEKTTTKPVVPTTSADSGTGLSDVVGAYWDQSASHHVYDALHDLVAGSDPPEVEFATGVKPKTTKPGPADEKVTTAAENAVGIQLRAASLADAVAASVGADASFFWQPNVFTKKLLPEEQAYTEMAGYDAARWVPAVAEARELLQGTAYVDAGAALDGATTPVLWDFVHTNEEGARLSADAIYWRAPAERSCAAGARR